MNDYQTLSVDEFRRAIEVFFVELNHVCLNAKEHDLQSSPRVKKDVAECIAELRDPENDSCRTLYLAYSLVDEYVAAHRHQIVEAAYKAYVLDRSRRKGPP